MRGVSAIVGGILIVTIMLSSIMAITVLYREAEQSIESEANYYGSLIRREGHLMKISKELREEGLLINGLRPEDIRYLVLVEKGGEVNVLDEKDITSLNGRPYIPHALLEKASTVFLILKDGTSMDIDSIKEASSRDAFVTGGMAYSSILFASLLARLLDTTDLYNLVENPINLSEPVTLNMRLPLTYTLKAENVSMIIEYTSSGCSEGKLRILYWGARADYILNVTVSETSVYYEKGTLYFIQTGFGTYKDSRSFPILETQREIGHEKGDLLLYLQARSYIELTARNPTPIDTCSNAFYYSPPVIGFNVWLNLSIHLPNESRVISLVPEIESPWLSKPFYYSETNKAYNYDLYSHPLYVYMKKSTLLAFYSNIYGTSQGGGLVDAERPAVRLVYSIVQS